jgi:prolyl-tRNA editing enzyme YbaK/EbsC (Cys-tRNA(Pro) deacylase)
MKEPYEAIIRLLDETHTSYEKLEHEPVFTSEEAAAVRGVSMSQAAKALLFKTKEGMFVLVVLSGDKRADSRALKDYLGTKSIRFATPEEVETQMGCKIGSCYPLGVVAGLRTLVDSSVAGNEYIFFNPGRHDVSIKMGYRDYEKLAGPELVTVTN